MAARRSGAPTAPPPADTKISPAPMRLSPRRRRFADDIAGIAQLPADRVGARKGGAEFDQPGIAMHEHQIEAMVDDIDDLGGPLRIVSADGISRTEQTIAGRGRRATAASSSGRSSRSKGPASEGVEFDQRRLRAPSVRMPPGALNDGDRARHRRSAVRCHRRSSRSRCRLPAPAAVEPSRRRRGRDPAPARRPQRRRRSSRDARARA